MEKNINNYDEIDISKIDDKYLNVIKNVINRNTENKCECFENIYHFISAFPNLSDDDYYRLSKYSYEEEWFCYLYSGLGDSIKTALDYCFKYDDEVQSMYLHYLIFLKYLGNDIKNEKYLFVNMEYIKSKYDEVYKKVLKKIETQEKLLVR